MSTPRLLLSLLLFVLTWTAAGQSCPDESAWNDLARYGNYVTGTGTIAVSEETDANGECGNAFRIAVSDVQTNFYDAGFDTNQDDGLIDEAGKTYRITFRYRAESARQIYFTAKSRLYGTFNSATDYEYTFAALDATTDYQTYTTTFTSIRQTGETNHRVYFLVMVGNSTVPVYLDDITMEEVACTAEGELNALSKYTTYNTTGTGAVTTTEVFDTNGACRDAFQVQFSGTPNTGNPYNAGFTIDQAQAPADVAGQRYRVSFRYRASAAAQVPFQVLSRQATTYTGGEQYAFQFLNLTTEYQEYSVIFDSEREVTETDHVLYYLFFVGGTNENVYIDNFEITTLCADESLFNLASKYNTYGSQAVAEVEDLTAVCDNAIRVTNTGSAGGTYDGGFQVLENEGVDDEAGNRYRLSFRYRADTPRDLVFTLRSRKRGTYGTDDTDYAGETLSATTTYQTYSYTFKSLREAGDADYHLYWLVANGNSTAAIYLDSIVMEALAPHHTVPSVLYVNPLGSDDNDGLANTAGQALRTMNFALGTLIPGDILYVADGTYRENSLRITDVAGTATDSVRVQALSPWGAKLEGGDAYDPVLEVLRSSYVRVEGFEVYNPLGDGSTDWSSGIRSQASNHVVIKNNYVRDCGCNGISGREGDYLTIERNVLRDNAKTSPYNCSGISLYHPIALDNAPGYHNVIRKNVAFENECTLPFSPQGFTVPTDGNGIILDDFNWTQADGTPYTPETLVENNLAFNNGGAGFKTYEVANATFRNNTAYKNNHVLEGIFGSSGEFNFQGTTGSIKVHNNIAHKAFGQAGHALSNQAFGQTGTITTNTNLWLGSINEEGGTLTQTGDTEVSEDFQAFTAFGDALAAVPAFTSVDDFRPLFGLRASSPGLDTGNDALAAAEGLNGTVRPQGAATDIGAYEGAVPDGGALPANELLVGTIPSTPQNMTLDGVLDGFYTGTRYTLTKRLLDPTADATDLAGSWTAAWTQDTLFLFVDVTDETLSTDAAAATDHDGVSVFFDVSNDKAGSYGADDYHFVLGYGSTTVEDVATGTASGHRGTTTATADGYAAEFAFSFADLGLSPTDSLRFGLEVIINDDDDGGAALDQQLSWQSTAVGAATDPSLFGEGLLTTAVPIPPINYTSASIVLDGAYSEAWRGTAIQTLGMPFFDAPGGSADLSASWRALWSTDSLYLLIEVEDDAAQDDSADELWYYDDGVEIYVDADNSKDFSNYGPNDYQITIDHRDGNTVVTDRKGQLGTGSVAYVRTTATGYVIEAALPWTALQATPTAGLFLGIDVHVNDDDDGGERDSKLSWYAPIDESFRNPALFGTAYLAPDNGGLLTTPGCFEAEQYVSVTGTTVELASGDTDGTSAIRFATAAARTDYTLDVTTAGLHTLSLRCNPLSSGNLDVYVNGAYANRLRVRTPRGQADGWEDFTTFINLPAGIVTLGLSGREAGLLEVNNFCIQEGHADSLAADR